MVLSAPQCSDAKASPAMSAGSAEGRKRRIGEGEESRREGREPEARGGRMAGSDALGVPSAICWKFAANC
jgi:hypothetical protein